LRAGYLSSNNIISIDTDSKGGIWIATFEGGLHKYNALENQFFKYSLSTENPDLNLKKRITSLFIDKNDRIWIGSYGHGLGIFDEQTGRVSFPSENEPFRTLKNKRILSLYEDSKGNLWIGEEGSGIYVYFPGRDSLIQYTNELSDKNRLL